MVITYYGGECFKAQVGDAVIVFNPSDKAGTPPGAGKPVRFGADVALVSLEDPDFNGASGLGAGGKEPFVAHGPGEYEVKDIFIKGVGMTTSYKGEKRINTAYAVSFEDINLLFLGAMSSVEQISDEVKALAPFADILFVPIGGDDVLSPVSAAKASLIFEPRVIIPMHYVGEEKGGALQTFLKEKGAGSVSAVDRLTIKKKDIEEKEGEVVVLAQTV